VSNVFDDMRAAVMDAEITLRAADQVAERLAELLTSNRLRLVSTYELRRLKRALAKFDSTARKWKD